MLKNRQEYNNYKIMDSIKTRQQTSYQTSRNRKFKNEESSLEKMISSATKH